MKRAIGLLVATLISGAALAAVPDSSYGIPPLDPGILLVEGSGAALGGAACAAGFGYLLARLYAPSTDVWKTFGGTVLGGSLGYPVFCGVGCWAAAKLTVAWVGTLVERLPPGSIKSSPIYVAAALIPPAGAVLGYNLSRPKATEAHSSRLGAPELLLGTAVNKDGSPCLALDVRLVSVRF